MTDAPETAAPQDTAPGAAPAPVRTRALAGLVDLVPSNALLGVLAWRFEGTGLFAGLLIVVIAFAILESRGGQTPGKALLGLEVRYLDGTPCDGRAAVIRNAFRFLDWFPGVYMIGGFAIASTRRRQRLGDQAAGTSVYRRSDLAELPAGA
jgi:uncharacterized RDD family membrane protein YckC